MGVVWNSFVRGLRRAGAGSLRLVQNSRRQPTFQPYSTTGNPMRPRTLPVFLAFFPLAGLLGAPRPAAAAGAAEAEPALHGPPLDPREVHLADLRQITRAGENAEAYW